MSMTLVLSDGFGRTGALDSSSNDNANGGLITGVWGDPANRFITAGGLFSTFAAPQGDVALAITPTTDPEAVEITLGGAGAAGNLYITFRIGGDQVLAFCNNGTGNMYGGGFGGNSFGSVGSGDIVTMLGYGTAIEVLVNGGSRFSGTASGAAPGVPGIGLGGNNYLLSAATFNYYRDITIVGQVPPLSPQSLLY